ncbi:MAG: 2-phospho-L-lactate transferase [Acidimicrobiales bacterium]|nr:2-phospho-L-lactate transferase [Acidimicrobiales bacterium]MXX42819.1 2-phospho-L-lactate transferase [Acidimicrobiales bacterium]MYA27398.1 2-phospho-L-lactate transferase [Acidimicrobiales bacterium]MYB81302.1 2-phospho-L-lactate transferase [Acidimicrobiales bacterium]MYD34278.1 2-phospho-L-lactate transferase [Acidimicrobiales bacterium]
MIASNSRSVAVLAGGVGAARFLSGLLRVCRPTDVTAIVNVGDDFTLHGLDISPDLDTVTYTLAGQINPETGWGRAGETWRVLTELGRLGGQDWFKLGDLDLALHLFRTQRRSEGASLSQVTGEIAASFGLELTLLPVSDDPIATRITPAEPDGATEIDFQEYFVAHRHGIAVRSVRFAGIEGAKPAPGVLDALSSAGTVVVAPSNPFVSIGPVIDVPQVRETLRGRRGSVIAVSPIVGGASIKGPAGAMMRELGHEPSVVGVARLYAEFAGTLVIDHADAELAPAVAQAGMTPVVTDTIMADPDRAAGLARATLEGVSARMST